MRAHRVPFHCIHNIWITDRDLMTVSTKPRVDVGVITVFNRGVRPENSRYKLVYGDFAAWTMHFLRWRKDQRNAFFRVNHIFNVCILSTGRLPFHHHYFLYILIPYFKFSPYSESCIFSFGYFPRRQIKFCRCFGTIFKGLIKIDR
jgi:hypothetical protein